MNIEWVEIGKIKANDYNPNVVFNQELELLRHSLMENGWVAPLIVDHKYNLVDGYHRWRVAQETQLILDKTGGLVPCVVLKMSRDRAKTMTVRMNRAKGEHVAVRMAEIVQDLIDNYGYTVAEVAKQIGATATEVNTLYENSIFKTRNLKDYKYSRAWVPKETGGQKK